MQASGTLVWCLLVAVIFTSRVNGCERGFMGSWNFNGLRQLLQNNQTNEFRKEAEIRRGIKAPTLQELTNMFNDINKGNVPKYVKDNNYGEILNSMGNYSYTHGNMGDSNGMQYGVFHMDGDTPSYSTLDFLFVKGKVGPYKYEAGTSFFTHVLYTVGDTFVSYQASTLGAILMKLPNGKYAATGNYTGLSQGNAMLFDEALSVEVNSLGIFHTAEYYSLNEITLNGGGDQTNFTHVVDVVSMTGGTNSSMTFNSTTVADNCTIPISVNGILMNKDKDSLLEAYTVMTSCSLTDTPHPMSEEYLPVIFSLPRVGVDIYLP